MRLVILSVFSRIYKTLGDSVLFVFVYLVYRFREGHVSASFLCIFSVTPRYWSHLRLLIRVETFSKSVALRLSEYKVCNCLTVKMCLLMWNAPNFKNTVFFSFSCCFYDLIHLWLPGISPHKCPCHYCRCFHVVKSPETMDYIKIDFKMIVFRSSYTSFVQAEVFLKWWHIIP